MDTSQYKGNATVEKIMKSPEQGAATTIVAALDKDLHGKGGLYLDDCAVSGPVGPNAYPGSPGYSTWAYDPEGETRLWKESCKLLGLSDSD